MGTYSGRWCFLSGVLTAESRAAQYKYQDIESAAAHLHGMFEELM
jgi:hypothetical protein